MSTAEHPSTNINLFSEIKQNLKNWQREIVQLLIKHIPPQAVLFYYLKIVYGQKENSKKSKDESIERNGNYFNTLKWSSLAINDAMKHHAKQFRAELTDSTETEFEVVIDPQSRFAQDFFAYPGLSYADIFAQMAPEIVQQVNKHSASPVTLNSLTLRDGCIVLTLSKISENPMQSADEVDTNYQPFDFTPSIP
jgi:hypothetical protein